MAGAPHQQPTAVAIDHQLEPKWPYLLLLLLLLLMRIEQRSTLAVVHKIIKRGDIGEAVVEDEDEINLKNT